MIKHRLEDRESWESFLSVFIGDLSVMMCVVLLCSLNAASQFGNVAAPEKLLI